MTNVESNEENAFLTLASLGAIVGFVIPLIMWALRKNEFSDYTKQFLLDILNFELVLLIIYLVLCFIPILGWFTNMILFVVNLIVALRCFSATRERKEYDLPIKYQLIK